MDQNMITALLGISPQCIRIATGDDSCSYLIATEEVAASSQ